MAIQALLYMDTICSHSWNARPKIARLREEYRDRLEFDYVCYPLIGPDASGVLDRRRRRFLSTHWAEVSEYAGEPIAHSLWIENPPNGSLLAGEAYLAARRQGNHQAHRLLERLQLSVMAQRGRISDPELIFVLAGEVGLDAGRLFVDLEEVRSAGEMSRVMEVVRSKGVRSRPTLVLSNRFGQEYWVIGPQPYEEFRRGAETLLGSPGGAPGVMAKVGGRILGYSDFEARSRRAVPGGYDFEVGFSGGRPEEPKRDGFTAVRLLAVRGGPALEAPAFEGPANGGSNRGGSTHSDPNRGGGRLSTKWLAPEILTRLWARGLGLVTIFGRRGGQADDPISLIGVRSSMAEAARTEAEAGLDYLKTELVACGLKVAPVETELVEWMSDLTDRSLRPAFMQFVPGEPAPVDLLLALPGDFALVTVLEPIPAAAVAAKREALLEAFRDYRRRLTVDAHLPQAAALAESIMMRETQAARWNPEKGMWRAMAYLLAVPGGGPAGTDAPDAAASEIVEALEKVYRDPALPSPLAVNPLHHDTFGHIIEHVRSFTLCDEKWLHGADWWNTPLAGEEAARYWPIMREGFFGRGE